LSTVVENGKGTRLRIVAVSTALLVAVAVFVLSRDRDPTESQEYKELLKKQAVVQDEISKIEAELNSLQQSIADSKNAHELQMESLNEKLENWQSVPDADNLLSLVRSLGA
jgi:peptidoglycan hydrolase CwlO-like protein